MRKREHIVKSLSVASDLVNTGKVFTAKKKAAAVELQIEQTGNMTVKDSIRPIDGVTVYEEVAGSRGGKRALNDRTSSSTV